MNKLKIGFIQANQKADVQWFKPLAFGYLKSYLNKNLDSPPLFEFIESMDNIDKYNIIAISSTSQDYSEAIKIAAEVKRRNKNVVTVLGGHHVTYLTDTLTDDFDLGIIGEGEETFLELVKYFQKNTFDLNHKELSNINGLAIRKGGKIILTGKRDLMIPLDSIPHPYRQKNDTQYLFTSRGCPYKCTFCSSSVFWERTRSFSAEYVVDEIEQILTLFPGIEHIPIEDDIFIINQPRLKKIISLMEERKLNKKVAFSFAVRANLVTDQLCELIKRLKIQSVCFGAESASDRILRILKKGTTTAINQKALDILHKHGINAICSFIVGIPTETEAEVIATYEFITRNIFEDKLCSFSAVNILAPMPGTPIWNQAIEQGTINLANFQWSSLAGFASYRSSNIDNFPDWVAHRVKNNSVYLNEDTLPQNRLYEIMSEYEGNIKAFENRSLPKKHLIFPESKLAHKYCIGKGLEIGGSAHNPFGLDTLNVDCTDSMETEFKKEEIRLCGKVRKVDIVASGETIPLSNESQDFIVSSHVLEHFPNPVKALIEWDRLVKPGGTIFMIVPHKERTFDKDRERTPLSHLVEDYKNNESEIADDEHGHHHVWITEDIIELVNYMIEKMGMKWELVNTQDIDDKVGNGFTIVIRKSALNIDSQHTYTKNKTTKTNEITMGFGALVNDPMRLDMVLKQSQIKGDVHFIKLPSSATSGLNKLLNIMQEAGHDVAALVHQDMYFRHGWVETVKAQLKLLPDDWIVAGIIGKDMKGEICGRLHDMRMPLLFNTPHTFPVEASCFDECCIFVNLKSQFRFDTRLDGFDLYGTLAVLQAEEMGGSAWIINAFAEHYCLRPFPWKAGKDFYERADWLKQRFPNAQRIDSTVVGVYDGITNLGETKTPQKGKEE